MVPIATRDPISYVLRPDLDQSCFTNNRYPWIAILPPNVCPQAADKPAKRGNHSDPLLSKT